MVAETETLSLGPFQRRAKRVKSNAGLWDLVEDLAASVDSVHEKLDEILLYVRRQEKPDEAY